MANKLCVVALVCLVLSGCLATGKPMTWKDKGFQFSEQAIFIIKPVVNKTGKTFEEDIPTILTSHLKDQFKAKSLTVVNDTDQPKTVFFVESDLLVYVTGSAFKRWLAPGAGKTQCTLKSRLIDKISKQMVAEIVAAKEVGAGGLYSVGAEKSILKDAASDIASEVTKLLSE